MIRPLPPTDVERRRFLLEMLPPASVGLEVGVHLGDFSQALLDAVSPAHLHLVDPWMYQPSPEYEKAWYGGQAQHGQAEMDARYAGVLARFEREIAAGRVTVHRGTSTDVLATLPDASLDWVYIDGNHRYEFVVEDLRLSLAKVKPGGLITGDDYCEGGWWDGGVKRAVDELVEQAVARLVVLQNGQYAFETPGGQR
jgi:hypothetical protein